MPDRRAGEAVDGFDAKGSSGACGVLDLVGGALADALGVAVAPDVWRDDALMPRIDRVTDGLPDQVVADGKRLETMPLKQLALLADILVGLKRLAHLKVVAPAGKLQPIVAKALGLWGQRLERKIGPLAGEERYRSAHCCSPGSQ
jgi:hypothetical protein